VLNWTVNSRTKPLVNLPENFIGADAITRGASCWSASDSESQGLYAWALSNA